LPGLIYDNVPTFFARNDMIGVNMTYRLAPQHAWPSGAVDVGQAVAWIRQHAARFGGNPERIFLMGQFAGATHVATWCFVSQACGTSAPGVAGAILLSGVFAPAHPEYYPVQPQSHQLAYFGDDRKNGRG
jgi:triacylglycerol lipase